MNVPVPANTKNVTIVKITTGTIKNVNVPA